jgi:hypothetical protein
MFDRLANKQDVEGALDEEDVIDALQLEELANQFKSPCRVVSIRDAWFTYLLQMLQQRCLDIAIK